MLKKKKKKKKKKKSMQYELINSHNFKKKNLNYI